MVLVVYMSFNKNCPTCQKLGHCPASVLARVTCVIALNSEARCRCGVTSMHILGFQDREYVGVFHTVLCCLNDREIL